MSILDLEIDCKGTQIPHNKRLSTNMNVIIANVWFTLWVLLAVGAAIIVGEFDRCVCSPTFNVNRMSCGSETGQNADGVISITTQMQEDSTRKIFQNVTASLLTEYNTLVASVLQLVGNDVEMRPRDCTDVQTLGIEDSGSYTVFPSGTSGFPVYCDMKTSGGAWTVIQRRVNGSVDFYLPWGDYLVGFGDLNHEFWLGNQQIHSIVSQGWYELRIEMLGPEDEIRYAGYDVFFIDNVINNFKLTVDGYHGDAGDKLSALSGMMFSTKDRDNDIWGKACAVEYTGAWWYAKCHTSNLNGLYGSTKYAEGITWTIITGYHKSLKRAEMKVRKWQPKPVPTS